MRQAAALVAALAACRAGGGKGVADAPTTESSVDTGADAPVTLDSGEADSGVRVDSADSAPPVDSGPVVVRDTGVMRSGDWVDVSSDRTLTCGIRKGGELLCWGETDYSYYLDEIPEEGSFESVDVAYGACAVATDGHAECWGYAKLQDEVDAAFAGEKFSLVAADSGLVPLIGLTEAGDLLLIDYDYEAEAITTEWVDGPFVDAAVQGDDIWAVSPDGTLNFFGVVWDGYSAPEVSGPFAAVSSGGSWLCGLTPAGDVIGWYTYPGIGRTKELGWSGPYQTCNTGGPAILAVRSDGAIEVLQDFSDNEYTVPLGPPPPNPIFETVTVGYRHACAITRQGWMRCWAGYPYSGYDEVLPPVDGDVYVAP